MSSIILLLKDDIHAEWTIINEQGERISPIQSHKLSEMSSFSLNKKVIVLICSKYTTQFLTKIPTSDPKKLRAAIPHALTEQLAEDQHNIQFTFTYAEKKKNEQIVTVISKKKLNHIQDLLAQAQLNPDKIYSTNMLLPYQATCWTILIDAKEILLNTETSQCHAFQQDDFELILETLLKSQSKPKQIRIFLMVPYSLTALLTRLKQYEINYHIDDYSDGSRLNSLDIFISTLNPPPESHLLESAFDIQKKNQITRCYFYFALGFFLIAFLITGLKIQLTYQTYHERKAILAQTIHKRSQAIYPGETLNQTSLKKRIQTDLDTIKYRQNNLLLNHLNQLANIFDSLHSSVKLLKMQYHNKQFHLLIKHPSQTESTQLINILKSRHYHVEKVQPVSKAKLDDKNIISEIVIQL